MKIDEALKSLGQVVEGIYTVKAVKALSQKYSVDMPISCAVYDVLYQNLDLNDAIQNLLTRAPKPEIPAHWIHRQNDKN